MVYMWSDQESVEELKHKLLCINFEVETAKMMAQDEVSKNEEIIKQLLDLLKAAYQERDEFKEQLQKLQNNFLPSIPAETSPVLSHNETPVLPKNTYPPMVEEPDSVCKTYNLGSFSFQGLPSTNFADSNNMGLPKSPDVVQSCAEPIQVAQIPSENSIVDPASFLLDNIVRVKPLPEKGRLAQAVMEAGPLLHTLLVAPLPKWKNPPTLAPYLNPPNLIYGSDCGSTMQQKEAANSSSTSSSYLESSHGLFNPQIPSSSVLNFELGSACFNNSGQQQPLNVVNNVSDSMHYQIPNGKRRRC